MPQRLWVIYNPVAGARQGHRLRAVLGRLADAGCEVRQQATTRRGDAEAFATALRAEDCDRLVVAGGDGTINEAVNGLLANQSTARTLPLAILPLGTANVLAAEIGLSTAPSDIAACILRGTPRAVTLGQANGRRFLLMAGAGFDAHVVAGLQPRLKRLLGKGAYAVETLRQMARFGFPRYRGEIDGVPHEADSVIVANARHYGGRFICAPDASLGRPDLEVCLFERGGHLNAMLYAAALFTGQLPRLRSLRVITGRRVVIAGPPEDPVQGDGDILAALPAEILVLPDSLNLVVPEGSPLAS